MMIPRRDRVIRRQFFAGVGAGAALLPLLVALVVVSCSPPKVQQVSDDSNRRDPGLLVSTVDGGTAVNSGSNGSQTGVRPGNGIPETCDGLDNDDNGIIDDLDAQGDGICDCLRIGTLGSPGRWGRGNVFQAWLSARSTTGARRLSDAVLTATLLADFQVIIVEDASAIGRKYSAGEVDALSAWIKRGGGLMTLIGYSESAAEQHNVNTLLAPFAISYGPDQILMKRGANTVPVTQWSQHPVTLGLKALGIDNGYPVVGNRTSLAMDGQWSLLQALEAEQGHVLVWADEWITYDSEWTTRKDYQVELFWVNALKWLVGPNRCQVPVPPRLIE